MDYYYVLLFFWFYHFLEARNSAEIKKNCFLEELKTKEIICDFLTFSWLASIYVVDLMFLSREKKNCIQKFSRNIK